MDFLFGSSGPYTKRELVLLGSWEPWLQFLVIALGIATLALTIYNYRRLRPLRRRILLIGIRSSIVLFLVVMFYQPAYLEENIAKSRNDVLVLIDDSESLQLPHGPQTRHELIKDFIGRHQSLWEEISKNNDLHFYRFSETLRALNAPSTKETDLETLLSVTGKQTRIVEALSDVQTRFRNRDLGGVIVLTDGVDTSAAGRRGHLSPAEEVAIKRLKAPIFSFTTAGDPQLKDIAVTHIAHTDFAFWNNASTLDVTIESYGYAAGGVTLRLLENGRELTRKTMLLEKNRHEYNLSFDFVPRHLGKQVYTIEASARKGEVYIENNKADVIINVIRDKIRVLQIVGQPSWDERFLRIHLKEDPNIDLISFFILVHQNNMRPMSSGETALIPFPARELFEEELGGFDLVIFQNFNYGPFQTRQYLPRIAQFVRDGGAFVMIGGPLSFSAGGYYGTPITDVLPIEISPNRGPANPEGRQDQRAAGLNTQRFKARLTKAGQHHPITRLVLDPEQNTQVWETLEDLEGVNMTRSTRKDAIVLVEHPTLRDDSGKAMPVIAVGERGQGRSMVVMTDSTWHWSFKAGNRGADHRHFDVLWRHAIRWLVKDPTLDLVRVRAIQNTVRVGERATAMIEVYQPDYQPATDQPVTITVRLKKHDDADSQGLEVMRLDDVRTDNTGKLNLEIPIEKAGIYEIEATSQVVSDRQERGRDLFVGSEVAAEFSRIVGDRALLNDLANASGGDVDSLNADLSSLALLEPKVTKTVSKRHRELWNVPFVLLFLVGLFSTEWWLRRKYGYL